MNDREPQPANRPSADRGAPAESSNRAVVSRRSFVAGGSASLAAVLSEAAAADASARRRAVQQPVPQRRMVSKADVAVVGAGLAGLSAARTIEAAGGSAVVLDARDRVGGRTFNHPLDGYRDKVVEVGGQWIGPTQNAIAALAKEVGVKTFDTYNSGENILFRSGSKSRYTGPLPTTLGGLAEIASALADLDQMAGTVPREAPWTAVNAEEWDSQTFATWRDARSLPSDAQFLLDLAIEGVWACEPRDVSLLHVLFYTNSAGDERNPGTFERLIGTAGAAQQSRFVGGSQLVSIELAKRLSGRVVLSSPVRRIVQGPQSVRVESDRLTVTAKAVIVAMAPAMTALIDYEPQLPAPRAQLTQRFPQGSAIKCEAVYDTPFWRADGLTGQATSDTEPVGITFDNSPPDGKPGVLLGFIEGDRARKWGNRKTAAERKAAVLDNFATYFGERARHPKQYIEHNWADERWTRGCYVGFTPPGVLLSYGEEIRKPYGRIHWAGTETATIWNGYMDGAVRSGERAAKEALQT